MAGFWPDKREIAAYVLLKERLGSRFNIGDALDVLQQYYPKKAAMNILKRLVKLGLLEKVGPYEYATKDLWEYLKEKSYEYLEARKKRYSSSSSSS